MSINKKLFFSLLIILLFLSISSVSANSIDSINLDSNYQNDLSLLSTNIDDSSLNSEEINSLKENTGDNECIDNNDNNDNSDVNGTLDIQEMINNAKEGDNLILPKTYIPVTTPIIIDKSLSINGKDSTFDGKGLSQLFIIQADNVILSNLNFINGVNPKGFGGAIFCNGANVIVSNCTFLNNSAYKGGAINWDEDNGLITHSYFVKNKASKGGAVYWDEPNGKISHSYFIKNFAYKGGAIYLEDGEIDIVDCHFLDNHVDNIYIEDDDDDDEDNEDEDNSRDSIPLENTGIPLVLLIISLLCVFISFKSKL